VGKTTVAAGLAAALARRNVDVGVMKPISSGPLTDTRRLRRAAGVKDSLDLITPVQIDKPLAPTMAAKKPIELAPIWRAYKKLASQHDILIVEGIGGLLVPIRKHFNVADLVARLGLPLVIVARPSLGTLNHTALTVEVARRRGLRVAGIIVNHHRKFPPGEAVRRNPAALEELCGTPVLGVVPWRAGKSVFSRIADRLWGRARSRA